MRIHRPPFGALLWDGYTWEGDIRLPLFARFEQTLVSVPRLERDSYEPPLSPDIFPLTVLRETPTAPTLEQERAAHWLAQHEPLAALATLTALLQLFRTFGEPQWQAEGMMPTFLRLANTLEGLRQTVRLVGITIMEDGTTGYEFAADWAPWEGLGVRLQGARFVGYGDTVTPSAVCHG